MSNAMLSHPSLLMPSVPGKLVVAVGLLMMSVPVELRELVDPQRADPAGVLRLGLAVGLLYGLLRGREWARSLALLQGSFGLLCGAAAATWALLHGQLGGLEFPVAVHLAGSLVVLWCVGHRDVRAWLMSRHLRE